MENSKPVATPMAIGCKLGKDDGSMDVDKKHNRSMAGGLFF